MTTEPTAGADTAELDASAFGRLAIVDPNTLELETNTRLDAKLDPHFCASIRDHGVQEPISVRRRASDGVLVVRKGQRRTLAAIRTGRAEVPVIISPEPATEDGADTDSDDYRTGQVQRIIEQLGENQHRRGIGDAEEVAAHQQLLALGLKPAEIAKTTRTKADRVRQTTQAAQSQRATAIGARYELDLVQMAMIAEFEDNDDAVTLLTTAAVREPDQFRHVAQRLRDERAAREVYGAAVAELTEAGVTVIDRDDDRYTTATRLSWLRPSDDDPEGTALDEDGHRDCPGHAGEVVTFRHFREGHQARVTWLCLDPATHGHAPLHDTMRSGTGAAAAGGVGAVETDEEREAREAREKEAQRAYRQRVIANNKAWESAETVRREWLAELLARKSAPKGAAIYVAAELGQAAHELRRAMETGNALACELLGLDAPSGGGYYSGRVNPLAEAARTAGTARATMLSLAFVLAAYEAGTSRDSWRNPTPATQQHLTQLREWGYPLCDVEQLALDPAADPTAATDGDATAGSTDAEPEQASDDSDVGEDLGETDLDEGGAGSMTPGDESD